jgi:CRP-like cAMP-binding protein
MIDIMSHQIRSFLDGMQPETQLYSAGQHIFELGDHVHSVHFVESGSVHLVRYQSDGAALILQQAGASSILAEASLYATTYHCGAEVQTESSIWAVPRRNFCKHLIADAKFSEAWSRLLAREVQQARQHAQIVSLKTVTRRLNAWIAWNGSMPPKGEWSRVASQIGVSPEALYRELARRRTIR